MGKMHHVVVAVLRVGIPVSHRGLLGNIFVHVFVRI